jgi:hypothetical protein
VCGVCVHGVCGVCARAHACTPVEQLYYTAYMLV